MNAVSTQAAPLRALMVGLGGEIFAIKAGMVREIIDTIPATQVAGARAHLPGVINVWSNVVPLADIRICFGMERTPATADTRIVVMKLTVDGDPVVVGIIADKIHDVTDIVPSNTQQTPRVGLHWRADYIHFIARWNEDLIIVPDMERILN